MVGENRISAAQVISPGRGPGHIQRIATIGAHPFFEAAIRARNFSFVKTCAPVIEDRKYK